MPHGIFKGIEKFLLHNIDILIPLSASEFIFCECAVGVVDEFPSHEGVRVGLAEIPDQPVVFSPVFSASVPVQGYSGRIQHVHIHGIPADYLVLEHLRSPGRDRRPSLLCCRRHQKNDDGYYQCQCLFVHSSAVVICGCALQPLGYCQ